MKKLFVLIVVASMFVACKEHSENWLDDRFPAAVQMSRQGGFDVPEDSLGVVEWMACEGGNLIAFDLHSGACYTLFDAGTGAYVGRFGTIGQGPAEIPAGCYGYLSGKCFSVFNDQVKFVMQYSMDSLRNGHADASPIRLASYDIPDLWLSRLIALNDSLFLGAGLYQSHYQYVLFDRHSRVMDKAVPVYNASDDAFNFSTRYLANQGDLVKHPREDKFAYSLNFSSNLDFFEIDEGKLAVIRQLHWGDPDYRPSEMDLGNGYVGFSADLTESSIVGYINLAATGRYVYALYSDKKVYESARKSKEVLVFDWDGNPVRRYALDADAYSIAVDEASGKLFAAIVKEDTGEWDIVCYPLNEA